MTVDDVYKLVAPRFRRKRIEQFVAHLRPTGTTTILDVGGCPRYWENGETVGRITVLNLPSYVPPPEMNGYNLVFGDGMRLPFKDQAFDIVHSNGVLVNLGTWEKQVAFSRELRRVARGLWVQTPAKSFPIECQTFDPFFHWFPPRIQRRFLRHFTLWGWITRATPQQVDAYLANNRMNTFEEMRTLFPDCTILREKVAGLTKSFVAVRAQR
jgi:hypothetical protein